MSAEIERTTIASKIWIDTIRAAAAFLVLIEHCRNVMFLDYQQVHSPGTFLKIFYLVSGTGHQAVIVFFVLSGYLVGGTVVQQIRRRDWVWSRYLTHRLVRLWIVLIPALLLGFMWDSIGSHLHLAPLLYAGLSGNHMTPDVASRLTPLSFAGNLAFLQTILVHPFGSNGALWSLANEWWYYILFPLALCAAGRVYASVVVRIVFLALFCAVAVLIGKSILVLFPAWLVGSLLCLIPKLKLDSPRRLVLPGTSVYLLIYFVSSLLGHFGNKIGRFELSGTTCDLFLAGFTALYIWLVTSDSHRTRDNFAGRLAHGTANFSYTLYLTHTPIIVFLAAVAAHDLRWEPTAAHISVAVVLIIVAVSYSWGIAWLTEFHTRSVRSWVYRKVSGVTRESIVSTSLRVG